MGLPLGMDCRTEVVEALAPRVQQERGPPVQLDQPGLDPRVQLEHPSQDQRDQLGLILPLQALLDQQVLPDQLEQRALWLVQPVQPDQQGPRLQLLVQPDLLVQQAPQAQQALLLGLQGLQVQLDQPGLRLLPLDRLDLQVRQEQALPDPRVQRARLPRLLDPLAPRARRLLVQPGQRERL
jgi:hypothetical protein